MTLPPDVDSLDPRRRAEASGVEPPTRDEPDGGERAVSPISVTAAAAGVALFSISPALIAGAEINGLAVGFWRVWFACAGMAVIAAVRGQLRPGVIGVTMLPGLAFGASTALFFTAVQMTSVANATLIGVLQPLPLLIAGRLFFRERASLRDASWIAVAIAGAGVMVLSARSAETGDIVGDLLAAASLVTMAVYFSSAKKARTTTGTLAFMVGLWAWAGVAMTPILFVSGEQILPDVGSDWTRIALIAAIPGAGHALTNYSHEGVPLALVGVLQLFTPVGSSLLAWWLLDQSVTIWQVVGIVVVVVALSLYTVQRSAEPKKASAEPERP